MQAPPSGSGNTGFYVVTAWNAPVHDNALNLDETATGQLTTPYAVDNWNFSVVANEQVQFNLVNSSSSAIEFDLTGPNGYSAFTNLTAGSGLITLPTSGNYILTAHLAVGQPGAYAFSLNETTRTALTLGTPYQGTLAGSGQAQLFTVTIASTSALGVVLTDANADDENEVYVSLGTAPTRDSYQHRYTSTAADQTLVLAAQPGTYYILVYDDLVNTPGNSYTLLAQGTPFTVTGLTPGLVGNGQAATLLLSGVFPLAYQSATAYQVQFVSASGTTYPTSPLYLAPSNLGIGSGGSVNTNGTMTMAVTLPANTLPAGGYSATVTDSLGDSQTMANALTVVASGAGVLKTSLSIPNPIGYHEPSIFYVTYSNIGTAPMAAPLLVLTGTQNGQQGAFMSLDPALAGLAYVSETTPAGFSQTVQFLASGAVPGILEPGESVTVPVYYAGWLQSQWDFSRPPIDFTVGELDPTNTQTIDWSSLQVGLQPSSINQAAWDAIFPTLTAQLGSTWGQYVQTLDNVAVYLASLGEPTDNLSQLLSFEIEEANAAYTAQTLTSVTADNLPAPGIDLTFAQSFQASVSGRYTEGILGFGWTSNWDMSATTMTNGDVVIENDGVSTYFSLQPNGSFAPEAGDEGTTLTSSGDAYELVATDGTTSQFNANGTINFIQDTNGNRITAGYSAQGQLVSLTASNGEYLDLAYNAQGRLATLTDSTGQTETYAYDPTGQFLTSYTDAYGTTNYTYVTGQSAAQDNALATITDGAGTETFFSYDSEGRLIDEHENGGAEDEAISYLNPGGYVTTDADGNHTTVYFNLNGATAETIDPLGSITREYYDDNLNLTKVIGPGGSTYNYTYDANGNLLSETDPLGLTTSFTYNANNDLTSYTDAKGNTTSYAYDSQNDLLSITYANGTQQAYTYNPLGEATQYLNANGQAIGYTYNAQGLVANENFADGTSYSYTYNAQGNLTSATDAQGNVETFVYGDSSNPNLLTEVEYPDGTWLKFSYNVIGQRTQSVDQTGFTVNYVYDSLGRLSELTDGSANLIVLYNYDAAGNLLQKDNGNGTFTIYTYDRDGDVLSIINYAPSTGSTSYVPANSTVNSFDVYTYDALGNVLTDSDQDGEWVYIYDADSELAQAVFTPNSTDPDGLTAQNLQYVYDAAGNRISETVNGVITTYVTNNVNEYISSTTNGVTTNYQYDADGNLIAQSVGGSATTYTFNELNELTAVNGPNVTASYAYDPLSNLISQTNNGTTTNYQVDPIGLGNVVAAYDDNGSLLSHYTYGLGLASQVSAAGVAGSFDFNNVGSTVGITGTNGSYVNKYAYLPFGQTITVALTQSNPFRFLGQFGVQEVSTDLLHTRARYYASSIGQFLSNDPAQLSGGSINLRAYSGSNPASLVDPTGEKAWAGVEEPGILDPALFSFGWAFGHAEIFFDDGTSRSFGPLGGSEGSNWFSGPGSFGDPGDDRSTYTNVYEFDDEDTLRQAINNVEQGGWRYNVIFSNCQDYVLDVIEEYEYLEGIKNAQPQSVIPPAPPDSSEATDDTFAPTSGDPNSMVGPAGYGTANFVSDASLLPYQILFENDPTATAPAQRVDITDQLDPNLDWTTLQLAAVGFGSTYIAIPAGLQHYDTSANVTENGQNFEVLIDLNLNPATGVFSASLQSIDPITDLPPDSVLTGFLPPEDGTGRGIGFVSFTINPKPGLATGTQIRNVADISFDFAPNIATDQVDDQDPSQGIDPTKQALVTIDSGPPTSSTGPLPPIETSTNFTVNWSGQDDPGGSGIASYNIYDSEDGGPYSLWQSDTTQTSATFTGAYGNTYSFYSVATDNVGNIEATPTAAQATTRILATPGTMLQSSNDAPTYGDSLTFTAAVGAGPSGSGTPTGTVQFLIDGVDFDSPVALVAGTATSDPIATLTAGPHTISAVYAGDNTFATSTASDLTETVARAQLTVRADNMSKVYGGADPTLTYAVTGLLNGDTPSVVTGVTLSTTTGAAATAGTHTITVTGGTAANYTITDVDGTLTVTKAPLTVTADNKSKVYGAADPTLTYTVSGALYYGDGPSVVSGVTLATATGTAATVGTHPITVTGGSAANYAIADVAGTLTVTAATTTPPPLVTMTTVQLMTNKKHLVTQIVISFSGAVNAGEAGSLATYRLATAGKNGSFTAKNAQVIKLKSTVYNPASDSVTLTPKKAFALTKPVQLVVHGEPPSGLQDSLGRLIDGGKNATALLGRRGVTITAVRYTNTNEPQFLLESAAVDAVLEREGAIAFNHAARAERRFRDEVAAIQRRAGHQALAPRMGQSRSGGRGDGSAATRSSTAVSSVRATV